MMYCELDSILSTLALDLSSMGYIKVDYIGFQIKWINERRHEACIDTKNFHLLSNAFTDLELQCCFQPKCVLSGIRIDNAWFIIINTPNRGYDQSIIYLLMGS